MALLATSALAGCGSHNHAPVVYGTAPNAQQTARIYTSPDQIAAERRAAQSAQYAARPAYSTAPEYSDGIAPAVAARGPAPLTPVTETGREGRTSYGSEPIYLAAAQAPEPAVTETLPGQVTVLPGDTVYAISRRTGATPQSIIALNRLQPPYAIEIGQTIRVPSSAVPPSHYSTTAVAAPAAPVEMRDGQHVVRPGDTLYSISRSTGASVAEIAGANRLRAPYTLSVGETLRIPNARVASVAPAPGHAAETDSDVGEFARSVSYGGEPTKKPSLFDWPVQGAIIGNYGLSSTGKRNDGVNIAAAPGSEVRAAAGGEVVYAGNELAGFGNLVLIRHPGGWVTAYAHSDALRVKEGDLVKQGQAIATAGQTGNASTTQVHFELRKGKEPVDPALHLPALRG